MKTYRNRCVLRLSRLSNVALGVEIERIQTALDQSEFTDIYPSTAEVRLVLSQYVECQQECSARNYKLVPARDAKKQELLEMLRTQCDGVNYLSKGDETKLKSSGFELLRAPQQPLLPEAGLITKVEPTTEVGSFKVTCSGARLVRYYEFESRGEDGIVRHHLSNHSNVIIDSYPAGERVELRVRASNSAGKGFWSAPFVYRVPFDAAKPKPSANTPDSDMRVA
jgi:hypothetical protein